MAHRLGRGVADHDPVHEAVQSQDRGQEGPCTLGAVGDIHGREGLTETRAWLDGEDEVVE